MKTITQFERSDRHVNKITEVDRLRVFKLLVDMLDYYRTNPRGVDKSGTCVYLCAATGNKCAVGMYLDTDHPSEAHLTDGPVDSIAYTVRRWDMTQPVEKQIDAKAAEDIDVFESTHRGAGQSYNADHYLDAVLKEDVRGLPRHMWWEFQRLHDDESNWTKSKMCKDGQILSARGVYEVGKFLERWGIGAGTMAVVRAWPAYLNDDLPVEGSLKVHPSMLSLMEYEARGADTANKAEAEAAK